MMLVAIEGIDQTGKETQAGLLVSELRGRGRAAELISFPVYDSPTGREIAAFLRGERGWGPEVRQLLFAANRYEAAARLSAPGDLIADRYSASGIAYGMAAGLPRAWLEALEARLPAADVTLLLDADPLAVRGRKAAGRDAYERNLPLLTRCRAAYLELAAGAPGWHVIDALQPVERVAAQVRAAVERHLAAEARGEGRGNG